MTPMNEIAEQGHATDRRGRGAPTGLPGAEPVVATGLAPRGASPELVYRESVPTLTGTGEKDVA